MTYYYKFDLNRKCNKCNLFTGKSVTGQSEVPFQQVKLIVISSYPGNAEEKYNLSLAPETYRKGKNNQTPAGVFIRRCFKYIFDNCSELDDKFKPFEKYTYFTNAIKCKKRNITIEDKHRQICKKTWLDKELTLFNPKTPILLAGSDPIKSLFGESETIFANRNKILFYKQHPVTVCENPINIERGLIKKLNGNYENIYKQVAIVLKSKASMKRKEEMLDNLINTKNYPMSFGMSNYFFKQDLENTKNLILEFINESI